MTTQGFDPTEPIAPTATDRSVEDSFVTGYEGLIETIPLPDPDARHVLAAAIATRADVIVTRNLRLSLLTHSFPTTSRHSIVTSSFAT
jgi:hypothetical protein